MNKKIIIALSSICALLLIVILCFGIHQCTKESIKFTINDTLPKASGKNAKVILLAGQSNASGCSNVSYLEQKATAEKCAEYNAGYDNIYINYCIPDSNFSNGFVKTAPNQGEMKGYFGPEIGLAEKLHEMYPNELFFIIKFAKGGTNLFSQWLSPTSDGKTGELYKKFISFTKQNIEYIKSKGYTPKIEGMCWMQGESDSFSTENATNYEIHLKNFVMDMRKDLKSYASSDGIAFVDALIANNPSFWVFGDLVNNSKKAVAEQDEKNVIIDTNAYELKCDQEPEDKPDIPHYDSLSQIKLGNLFAEYVAQFF